MKTTVTASRLEWLNHEIPKVPVDVAASGPRVIALGAVVGDRVTFAVGANPDRVTWAIKIAHEARQLAGLSESDLGLGAYVTVVPHDDLAVARTLSSGTAATFARFTVMHGRPTGPVDPSDHTTLVNLHEAYEMKNHAKDNSQHSDELDTGSTSEFVIVPASIV